jgi:membrane-bound lytic murein transglycosylase F
MGSCYSKRAWPAWFVLFSLFCLAPACELLTDRAPSLEQIRKRGHIVLITQNSANTYYIYREEPHGFEYELAKEFARELGVDLKVVVPGWIEMFDMLAGGKGDLIAAGVTILPSRQKLVDFSAPYMEVHQEIIVHRNNRDIRTEEDLSGRTVQVRAGTSYQKRMSEIKEKGVDLEIVAIPDIPTEELIEKVAEGEIEVTVADSNIALLNRRYYPGIRIAFPVSEKQSLGWAVRKGNETLLEEINRFLSRAMEDGTYQRIYDHYYDNRVILGPVDIGNFEEKIRTRFPRYEEMIRRESEAQGFDWRLIAAMIYQESHFNPRARSYTGVRGLMQVTLATAAEMGIENRMDPEDSIRAGVRYLANLRDRFEKLGDEREKILFALASYNVGYGHVRDAQKLAARKGLAIDTWSSLKKVLPLLSRPEYYRELPHGYARGNEPVRYVQHILTYYDILRNDTRLQARSDQPAKGSTQ